MLRTPLALCLLIAAPVAAQTAAQEDRFHAAMQAMEARTRAFYISVDPRFASLLAPGDENPAFRDSQRCLLRRLADEGGADMLAEYIAAAEFMASSEITSLVELGERVPSVMTSDLVFAAAADCGPMSQSTKAMMTPEFQDLMDDPKVMQGLMGQ